MAAELTVSEQIIAAIRRLMRTVDLHSRRLFAMHGITEPQFVALRAVETFENPTVGELARAVHLSQATVTGIVNRLEERKLVRRAREGKDRRTVQVSITDEGRRLLCGTPRLLRDRLSANLAELREWEQTTVLATLQRLAEMMEAAPVDASPVLMAGPIESGADATPAGNEHTSEDLV